MRRLVRRTPEKEPTPLGELTPAEEKKVARSAREEAKRVPDSLNHDTFETRYAMALLSRRRALLQAKANPDHPNSRAVLRSYGI